MSDIAANTPSTEWAPSQESTQEPYRGLRYFDEPDAHLFFGRDEQIDDVLERLRRSRFIAVLGSSGSGKSSLLRAGLIPALRAGLLVQAGGRWRVVITQPANRPIRTLAERVAAAYRHENPDDVELTMRRGPLGLRQWFEAAEARRVSGSHTLLVVDQFEEIFRFQREAAARDASRAAEENAAYVKLLLAVTGAECPVYVVLTMRSDFLGNCAQFRDLPERINDGIYLVPRMARDQLKAAIAGPVAVVGGEIDPALVQRVLNDVGEDPDQLPTLQHALLMTWRQNPGHLTLDEYQLAGTLKDALSRDANRVFDGLSRPEQRIAQVLFQCLSERDGDRREVRRRCTAEEVAQVAGSTPAAVLGVAQAFCRAGLLLQIGGLIDVIHESLLRKWDRLQGTHDSKGWLDDEAEARDIFLEFERRERRRTGSTETSELLRGADLTRARTWARSRRRPAWGRRYVSDGQRFRRIRSYIAQSLAACRADDRERHHRAARRFRLTMAVVAGSLLVAFGFGFLAFYLWQTKNDIRNMAVVSAAREIADHDPTRALLLLDEVESAGAMSTTAALQTALRAADGVHSTIVYRHAGPVRLAAFSPDGGLVATVTVAGEVTLWSSAAGPFVLPKDAGPVSQVEFSRDGARLVAGMADGSAWEWRIDAPTRATRYSGHRGPINTATFEPSASPRVLTASMDGTVRIWTGENASAELSLPSAEIPRLGSAASLQNLSEALLQRAFVAPPAVHVARFSPDGRVVAAGRNDGSVLIWPADAIASPLALNAHAAAVRIIAFNVRSDRLLTAGDDGLVKIWSLGSKPQLLTQFSHAQAVTAVGFDPTGIRVLTASGDGTIRVSYTNGKPPLDLTGHRQPIMGAQFSPDGQRVLAVSLDGSVWVWNVDAEQARSVRIHDQAVSGTEIVRLAPQFALLGHEAPVWSAVFDVRGERVLTASDDGTARVWELTTEGLRSTFMMEFAQGLLSAGEPIAETDDELVNAVFGSDGSIVAVARDGRARAWFQNSTREPETVSTLLRPAVSAVSPGGGTIAAGFDDGSVHVLNLSRREPIVLRGPNARVQTIGFSPTGTVLGAGFVDGSARIWRLDDPQSGVLLGAHTGPVSVLAFAPDGRSLATASDDGNAIVWSVEGRNLRTLRSLRDRAPVGTLAFSPDGSWVVTGGGDGKARIWDLTRQTDPLELAHGSQITSVAFNADSHRLLTVSTGEVKIWSGRNWREVHTLPSRGAPIIQAAFAPAGKDLIVIGSADGVARIWPQNGLGDPIELRGHTKPLVAALFSSDARHLLTGSRDGRVRLWRLDFRDLVDAMRRNVKSCLSVSDRMVFLRESQAAATRAYSTCEGRRM